MLREIQVKDKKSLSTPNLQQPSLSSGLFVLEMQTGACSCRNNKTKSVKLARQCPAHQVGPGHIPRSSILEKGDKPLDETMIRQVIREELDRAAVH